MHSQKRCCALHFVVLGNKRKRENPGVKPTHFEYLLNTFSPVFFNTGGSCRYKEIWREYSKSLVYICQLFRPNSESIFWVCNKSAILFGCTGLCNQYDGCKCQSYRFNTVKSLVGFTGSTRQFFFKASSTSSHAQSWNFRTWNETG